MNATQSGIVMRRWTEQRWLLDNVIRSVGIDWDQPRTITYNAPCGEQTNADFAGIRERVKKFADQDSRHCVGNVPSAHLGPHPQTLVADWINARLNGVAFASERWFVEASGHIVKTPYTD